MATRQPCDGGCCSWEATGVHDEWCRFASPTRGGEEFIGRMLTAECAALRARAERAERDVERLTERVHKADGMAQEVNLLTGEVRQVTARAERAEEALRVTVAALEAVEWADNSGDEYTAECPWCEADGPVPPSWRKSLPGETGGKHRDDCQRQAALAAARTVAAQLADGDADATVPPDRELLKSEPDPADVVSAFFAEKEGR